jgi:hypothetical protein
MREAFEEFVANFIYPWRKQIIILTIGLLSADIFLFFAWQAAAIPDEAGPRGGFYNGIRDIKVYIYALGALISLICSLKWATREYRKDKKRLRNMF